MQASSRDGVLPNARLLLLLLQLSELGSDSQGSAFSHLANDRETSDLAV
jgi:hypothetical protein